MITKVPNPVLFQKAKPVGQIDKKTKKIIQDLKTTLTATDKPKGVGLAAPQIGVSLRIFAARPKEKDPVKIFINPQILWKSDDLIEIEREEKSKKVKDDKKLEGCLSIDNVWGHLKRSSKVKIRYMDEKGEIKEETFSGFIATIVQHETDHLDGILFTKRVLEQNEKIYSIEEDDKGKETLVEIKI